jgi:4a-hydroxytetrahydrobiopterin dehydratase
MSELSEKHCKPCEGDVTPLSRVEAKAFLQKLHPEWRLAEDSKSISREWKFKNFYHTMSFVNAAAYIANAEDHHPDLEVGYGYCRMKFNTHSIGGLSENDFICGAKMDALGAAG